MGRSIVARNIRRAATNIYLNIEQWTVNMARMTLFVMTLTLDQNLGKAKSRNSVWTNGRRLSTWGIPVCDAEVAKLQPNKISFLAPWRSFTVSPLAICTMVVALLFFPPTKNSFTFRSFYSRGRNPLNPWNRKLAEPQNQLEKLREWKYSAPCRKLEYYSLFVRCVFWHYNDWDHYSL